MMSRRQAMQRYLAEVPVLEFVDKLRVFVFVVLISNVELCDSKPDNSAEDDDNGKGQI
jgi:hypothetical protein